MGHEFLSDEWFAEVDKIRADNPVPPATGPGADIKLNITVTGAPGGDKDIHMDAGEFGEGHVEAPTKMTVPYEVAKKVFIDQDQQAGMQAFMQGQIKVEGDMSKLMAMQTAQPSAEQTALMKKIAEITA
jgi:hypothetical protein